MTQRKNATGEYMKRTLTTIMVLLLLIPLFGFVEETASLKNFLFGSEPACSYDKWVSHLAEGIAYPGYNTYAPYDRQLSGFGNYVTPSSAQLTSWGTIVDLFLAGDFESAQLAIDNATFPYEIVLFHDIDTNRTYYLLREIPNNSFTDNNNTPDTYDDETGAFAYGWGLYVYNPQATRPIIITVPHPCDDFPTPYIGYEALKIWDARFLLINGAGREVKWTQVGTYTNSKTLSDPTRVAAHPFNTAYKKFADKVRLDFDTLEFSPQIHSYDWNIHAGFASNQISAGNPRNCPNLPIRDLSSLKRDMINMGSDLMIPANTIGIHSPVYLNDYYAVNYTTHDFTFQDGELEYAVNPNIDLPAYQYNQQMTYTQSGTTDYDVYEPFFHVEMDELPNCYELTDNTYKWFYGWNENAQRWDYDNVMTNFLSYYLRWVRDLDIVMDDMFNMDDSLTPPAPQNLYVQNQSLTSITLGWTKTDSYDFDTYEVLYATEPISDANYSVFSRTNNPYLASPDCELITVTGLNNANNYYFQVRAKDKNGNLSPLSNEVTTIPAPANITGFYAYGMDASVRLNWTVSGQNFNQGFTVYRKNATSEYVMVDSYLTNMSLSNSTGTNFEWWDNNVVNGDNWTYMISSTNLNGQEFNYNYPASATPQPLHRIYVRDAAGTLEDSITFSQNAYASDGQDTYYDVSKSTPSASTYVWNAFWEQYWGNNGTHLTREIKGGYNIDLDVKTWVMRVRSTQTNQPLFISASSDFNRAEKLYLYDNGTGSWHNLFTGPYQFTVANTDNRTMTLYWGNLQPKVTHTNQSNKLFQGGSQASFMWSNQNNFLTQNLDLYIKNATDSLFLASGVPATNTSYSFTVPQDIDMPGAKFYINVHAVDGLVSTYASPYTFALVPATSILYMEPGWHMASSPWSTLVPSVTEVFGAGSSAYTSSIDSPWLQQESFLFGSSYWVNLPGEAIYSSNATISSTEVTYALQPGWNFIPNPHLISYPLSTLRFTVNNQLFRFGEVISQKLISPAVYVYRNGAYIVPTEILPYESLYVKYYGNPTVGGYISFYPYFTAPVINPPDPNWQYRIDISSETLDSDGFVLGASPIASDGYDFKLDTPTAPEKHFPSLRTYLTRENPEDVLFTDTKLRAEFRSPFSAIAEQAKTWDFTFVTPDTNPVNITVTGINIPQGYGMQIFLDNNTITYSPGLNYIYTPSSAGEHHGQIVVTNYPVSNSDLLQTPISGLQVYPNPFNPSTTIAFSTPVSSVVNIELYNIRGQKVRNLHQGTLGSGSHKLVWDGKDDHGRTVGSGVYFARINADKHKQTVKMVLMK